VSANKFAMPIAWPQTVREALRAIQFRTSDVDAPHAFRTAKAERRHAARVAALEAALELAIATHGLEANAGPDEEHGCFVLSTLATDEDNRDG